ncbi:hypothetical protein ACFQ6N_01795 [Kitasatospora sp. NPDC056446]|uniref:hypothetical protein n=1 Tax=Kitasatospora sp. NPDC056446 TaxID=3345819 RepID=UPI0036B5B55A
MPLSPSPAPGPAAQASREAAPDTPDTPGAPDAPDIPATPDIPTAPAAVRLAGPPWDLTVEPGTTVALFGPRADVTALFDRLLGLRPAAGLSVLGLPPAEAVRTAAAAGLPAGGGLPAGHTVAQVLAVAGRLGPRPADRTDLATRCGIGELSRVRTEGLPAGGRALVRLAVALAHTPELLVLDHPTEGLHADDAAAFWDVVRAHRGEDRTVLLAVDDPTEAERVADRVLVLGPDAVLADAAPGELAARVEGRLVAFESPDAALAALRELPGVAAATGTAGQEFRLLSTDSDSTVAALHTAGLRPARLRIAAPGLAEALAPLLPADPEETPR